jgi:MFS transporter, SHS family, sialic acid transporter
MRDHDSADLTSGSALRDGIGRQQWLALTAALLGWMFDGVEQGLFPLVARPALKELMGAGAGDQIGTWISAIMATFLVGAALGGLLFGWLGDRIGRVRAMAWSVLVYSLFSGLCAFSQAPWHLALLRLVAALGMGGEWALGVALVMEVWPSRSRPTMAALIGASANVGFLLIALAGLGTSLHADSLAAVLRASGLPAGWTDALIGPDLSCWRFLMLLGAAPAVLTFFIRLFVPESPRWQQAISRAPAPRIAEIFAPGLARNTVLATCLGAVALLGTWGSVQWLPSWADRLSHGDPSARPSTQIASALGAIVGTVAAAYLAAWTSRRLTYFMLALSALVVCGYLFGAPQQFDRQFLLLVGLTGCVTASFYGWLPLYLPELFPTRVRATGQGFAYNFGRVLAAVGVLGTGRLLAEFHEDYARTGAVTSLIYVVGLVLIWFCPETKGRPLPD